MKNVNKPNKLIILLVLCITAACIASSDAIWWQRLVPSTKTLQGIAWTAPGIVAAQRFFMPHNKLPWYVYLIPGLLGTAVGTVARSDQGLAQACASSACNQIPSFIIAAMLMAGEKWQAKNIQEANLKKFNELYDLIGQYQIKKYELLRIFERDLIEDLQNHQLFKEAYNTLVNLYIKIIAMRNDFFNQWNSCAFHRKDFNSQYYYVTEVTYLTPAQEIYADYIAYAISDNDIVKDLEGKIHSSIGGEQLKELIKKQIETSFFVMASELKGWGITTKNTSIEESNFLKKLNENNRLLESLSNRIKKYQIIKKYEGLLRLDLSKAFETLVLEYIQKINEFVSSILADRVSLDSLNALYVEIKQIYQYLKRIADKLDFKDLLKPHDYIRAAIYAYVIKSELDNQPLKPHEERSKGIVFDKIKNVHNDQISAIVQKSSLLKNDLSVAMNVADVQRDDRFIIKIIDIINQLREHEEVLEEVLLTSELQNVLGI